MRCFHPGEAIISVLSSRSFAASSGEFSEFNSVNRRERRAPPGNAARKRVERSFANSTPYEGDVASEGLPQVLSCDESSGE